MEIICLFLLALVIFGFWKVFGKSKLVPSWASLIPFYNIFQLTKLSGKPRWYFYLIFIPYFGILPWVAVNCGLAVHFDRSIYFGIGLAFLPFIFYPVLGINDAKYEP